MQNSSYKPSLVEVGRTSYNLGQSKDLTAPALIILQLYKLVGRKNHLFSQPLSGWVKNFFVVILLTSVFNWTSVIATPLSANGAKPMNWSLFSFGFNKCSQIFKTILCITKVNVKFEPSTGLTDFDGTLLKVTSKGSLLEKWYLQIIWSLHVSYFLIYN